MDEYQYLLLMGACLAVTLPLELVVGARVYRQPRRLVSALAPALLLFAVWDAVAIARRHWWFTPRYVTGWTAPFDVPVEELVFFVVVPICALLTYEAIPRVLALGRSRVAGRA
jgi:lycopene cyclase domain-containing protein